MRHQYTKKSFKKALTLFDYDIQSKYDSMVRQVLLLLSLPLPPSLSYVQNLDG